MPLVTFTARDTYGLGIGIATDLGKSSSLGSVGNFGWTGAATTLLQMDPKERMVMMVLCQLRPADHSVYGTFINMAYSALEP
jgi:CubicO group peptidase (beta-lactamase class C family)